MGLKHRLKNMSRKKIEADDSFYLGRNHVSKFHDKDGQLADFVNQNEIEDNLILSRYLTVNFLISKYF